VAMSATLERDGGGGRREVGGRAKGGREGGREGGTEGGREGGIITRKVMPRVSRVHLTQPRPRRLWRPALTFAEVALLVHDLVRVEHLCPAH
jgi:hypothetical protein